MTDASDDVRSGGSEEVEKEEVIEQEDTNETEKVSCAKRFFTIKLNSLVTTILMVAFFIMIIIVYTSSGLNSVELPIIFTMALTLIVLGQIGLMVATFISPNLTNRNKIKINTIKTHVDWFLMSLIIFISLFSSAVYAIHSRDMEVFKDLLSKFTTTQTVIFALTMVSCFMATVSFIIQAVVHTINMLDILNKNPLKKQMKWIAIVSLICLILYMVAFAFSYRLISGGSSGTNVVLLLIAAVFATIYSMYVYGIFSSSKFGDLDWNFKKILFNWIIVMFITFLNTFSTPVFAVHSQGLSVFEDMFYKLNPGQFASIIITMSISLLIVVTLFINIFIHAKHTRKSISAVARVVINDEPRNNNE